MKILIIKIGALGDVAMALSLALVARKKYPHAHITWLTGKTPFNLLKNVKEIDQVLCVDDNKLIDGSFVDKVKITLHAWRLLKRKAFDLKITAHVEPRYKLLSLWCRAKEHRFFYRTKKGQFPVPGRFHSHEYIRLITKEDGPIKNPLVFPSVIAEEAQLNKKLIVIAPGGNDKKEPGKNLRRWPIESYQELALELQKSGYTIALIGGADDSWVEPYFKHAISYIGKTSVMQTISILQNAALLITHDSGPLHLGRIAKTKILGLFGPTAPHEKMGIAENEKWLWGGLELPCRPCYDGKFYAICRDNLCMKDITTKQVYEEALGFIKI